MYQKRSDVSHDGDRDASRCRNPDCDNTLQKGTTSGYCADCYRKIKSGELKPRVPYLSTGYLDEKGNIHLSLLTDDAREQAGKLRALPAAPLRGFFELARLAERRLDSDMPFEDVVPFLVRMRPLAHEHATKGVGPESQAREYLRQFIEKNVPEAVKSEEAFRKGFLPHFEAVVAYYHYLNKQG
ncbi:type III-A CRISPR-associated protein Csm2 [Candidatus Poribacteria bacterium]|nr:type III-A CRISPR-associated protein Csm2 [Candidatus Poribacteria bacterium]